MALNSLLCADVPLRTYTPIRSDAALFPNYFGQTWFLLVTAAIQTLHVRPIFVTSVLGSFINMPASPIRTYTVYTEIESSIVY